MAGRKKGDLTEPFDYAAEHDELMRTMTDFHISRIEEMPRIELYRDQMLSIVNAELAPLYESDEKIITGSMVNNYVKQQVVPAPQRKRYTRRHLATLLFVCILKRVLSISQIAQLLEMLQAAEVDLAPSYDVLVGEFETALASCFSAEGEISVHVQLCDRDGVPVSDQITALLDRAIGLVANKVYVEKMLDLEDRRVHTEQAG